MVRMELWVHGASLGYLVIQPATLSSVLAAQHNAIAVQNPHFSQACAGPLDGDDHGGILHGSESSDITHP